MDFWGASQPNKRLRKYFGKNITVSRQVTVKRDDTRPRRSEYVHGAGERGGRGGIS